MIIRTKPIFRLDAKGGVRFWQAMVDGDKWCTVSGIVDGQSVTSGWTYCEAKNIGRSNATTPEAQALFEAQAEEKKKLDRDYRRTLAELSEGRVKPMLAYSTDDINMDDLAYPLYVQPKLDGIRSLMSRDGAKSREGKPQPAAAHILSALEPVFAAFPSLVIDGELYNHEHKDDFEVLSSLIRKTTPEELEKHRAAIESNVQYHIYDVLLPLPFSQRVEMVNTVFSHLDTPMIQRVKTLLIASRDVLDSTYEQFMDEGYEGQMLRKNEPYQHKRTKFLLKRKEVIDGEFRLVRIEEGNGNWKGAAKRAIVELPDGGTSEAGIIGDLKLNKKRLEEADRYVGGQVTVSYQGFTKAGKLRFGRVKDFHPLGLRTD